MHVLFLERSCLNVVVSILITTLVTSANTESTTEPGIGSRLGVCRCGREVQPPSNVLAFAVGGRESAQTVVGSLASHCCRAAVHILRRDCRAANGKRTLDSVPVGRCRCRLHWWLGSLVFCFKVDRRVAVEPRHREVWSRLQLYRCHITVGENIPMSH